MHDQFIEKDAGDFQHSQISLLWKVTNDTKSNMYITPVFERSSRSNLAQLWVVTHSDALVLQDSESGRQEPSLTLAPLQFEMKL